MQGFSISKEINFTEHQNNQVICFINYSCGSFATNLKRWEALSLCSPDFTPSTPNKSIHQSLTPSLSIIEEAQFKY